MKWIAALALIILVACGPREPSVRDMPPYVPEPTIYSDQVQRLEGTWVIGFEHNQFREEGRSYLDDWGWCFATDSPAYDDLFSDFEGQNTSMTFDVVVEGQVSEPSEYGFGHMGLCEREVRVTRVIESRMIDRTPVRIATD